MPLDLLIKVRGCTIASEVRAGESVNDAVLRVLADLNHNLDDFAGWIEVPSSYPGTLKILVKG